MKKKILFAMALGALCGSQSWASGAALGSSAMNDYTISISGKGQVHAMNRIQVYLCIEKVSTRTCNLMTNWHPVQNDGRNSKNINEPLIDTELSLSDTIRSLLSSKAMVQLEKSLLVLIPSGDTPDSEKTFPSIPLTQIPLAPQGPNMHIYRGYWWAHTDTNIQATVALKPVLKDKKLDGQINMPRHLYRPSVVAMISKRNAANKTTLEDLLKIETLYFTNMNLSAWKTLEAPLTSFTSAQQEAVSEIHGLADYHDIDTSAVDLNFTRFLATYYMRLEDAALLASDPERFAQHSNLQGHSYQDKLAQAQYEQYRAQQMRQAISTAAQGGLLLGSEIIKTLR